MATWRPDRCLQLVLICIQLLHVGNAQQVCYWPNKFPVNSSGSTSRFWPCHDGSGPCCAEGEVCLSNGLCYVSSVDTAYRGACTNPDWTGCPDEYCNDVQENTTSNIWKCPLDGFGNEFYWCGDERRPNTIKCHTDAEFGSVVIWTTGTPVTIASPPTASDSTTAPIFGGSITKSTPSEPTNESLQARSGGSSTIVTTGATSVIYRNQTVAGNKSSTTSMAIGAGLGVPLGIVSFGLIGYLFLRNRSRKNDAPAHVPQPSMDNRVKSPRSPRICHELIGDVNPSELPALPSIYEI